MNTTLTAIQETAAGLLFMSESDFPFDIVHLPAAENIEQQLQALAQKQAPVERQSVDYFFRNAVKTYPGASETQLQIAHRFQRLQEQLQTTLEEAQVYRIGETEVDAFIIGRLPDGSYGGLHTKLIET